VVVGETLKRNAHLAQVSHTFDSPSPGFAFAQGGQEQGCQEGNDGDDNKQFQQCEGRLE
jgi:hypothetical protein